MTMPFPRRISAFFLATLPLLVMAEELARPAPLGKPSRTVYRQILPDGRIVYSDKPVKGAKLDETLTIEPPVEGANWAAESGRRPVIPPRVESTPVNRVPSIAPPGKRRTMDDADTDVIRAEMLLEDARKRQEAGVEPLPGERTANVTPGTSRLNEDYHARQKRLAEEVAIAENVLKKAIAERNSMRTVR